jgi:hypothetical protein
MVKLRLIIMLNHHIPIYQYQAQNLILEEIPDQKGKYCIMCGEIVNIQANYCPMCGNLIQFNFYT